MTLARNRTAEGPFIIERASPLRVRRDACWRVLMRDQRPGATHGRWQPISTNGFVVVCPSRLEACECVWIVGGRYFPRPDHLVVDGSEDAETAYLRWLLDHHFRLEPYTKGSDPMEVWFSDFLRGWYPSAEDIPGVGVGSRGAMLVAQSLRSRWEDR